MSAEFFPEVSERIGHGGGDDLSLRRIRTRPTCNGEADGGSPPPRRVLLAFLQLAGE